ncbi:MAG: hypothetical protein JXR76_07865 [Deltaproteobacteria bacterium]|nr:hypothetical protein [Deltaproteobacteria bacterium]
MKNYQIIMGVFMMLWLLSAGCSDDKKASPADTTMGTGDTTSDSLSDTADSSSTDTVSDTTDSATESTTPGFTLVSILPAAVNIGVPQSITLQGTGFQAGMTVSLVLGETVFELGGATVDSVESASVTIPAGAAISQGLYNVVLTLPDTTTATLTGALTISTLPPPEVSQVEPALAWMGLADDGVISDKTIQISGANFVNTPWVILVSVDNPDTSYPASEVNFMDENTLVATIPSETAAIPAGDYHVWVTNPDRLAGQWMLSDGITPGVFEITASAPPQISSIDPVQNPFNEVCAPFTVTGLHFNPLSTLSLLTADGEIALSVTSATETQIVATIPADTLELGLYPVLVVNPDGQSDTFYAFEAKSPTDGHFTGNFEQPASALNVARERHAVTFGFDMNGGTWLYAAGGLDAQNGVLGNVEAAAVNIYGNVGEWRLLEQWQDVANPRVENSFMTQRSGHAMVRIQNRLFAIGGNTWDTSSVLNAQNAALDTIETATILGEETRVSAAVPTRTADGALPTGTWYYRISAVGPSGEGLPSNEVQLLNSGGALQVCFETLANVASYNVYRSVAADGRHGSTRWITSVTAEEGATQCVTDDGSIAPAPGFVSAETNAGGTLAAGVWIYRVSSVVDGVESVAGYRTPVSVDAENATVALRWSPVVGATYNVYRTNAAAASVAGDEETYLVAEGLTAVSWVDDGSNLGNELIAAQNGVAPLPVGSLSSWQTLATTLSTPREGAAAAVVATQSGTHIVVAGGRSDGGPDNYLSSVEILTVQTDGSLTPPTVFTESLQTARAFLNLASSQGMGTSPLNAEPIAAPAGSHIVLFAVAGDESFSSPAPNDGLMTIEAAILDADTLTLGAWTTQNADLSAGRTTYAGGAAVVDNYLYALPGVDNEQDGVDTDGTDFEPVPLTSLSTRFEIVASEPISAPSADFLTGFMSSNGGFVVPRSYYGTARVNSHIYIIGGNDGAGPVDSIEKISQ